MASFILIYPQQYEKLHMYALQMKNKQEKKD